MLGREPQLTGEPVPPEVLKGIEKQTPSACNHPQGTIRYARADVLYSMDFEAIEDCPRAAAENPRGRDAGVNTALLLPLALPNQLPVYFARVIICFPRLSQLLH